MNFLTKSTAGVTQLVSAINSSAGVADAGKIIALDANGLIDPSFLPPAGLNTVATGVIVSNGVTVNAGDFVAINASGEVVLADSGSITTEADGFVITTVVGDGILTVDVYKGQNANVTTTAGTRYFLSTAGGISTTPPAFVIGDICQLLGNANETNTLEFEYNEAVEYAAQ